MDIQEFAEFVGDGHVEVEQVLPVLLKERADVIYVVIKERTVAIGAHQGIPVQVAPIAVVTDTYIRDESGAIIPFILGVFHGDAQGLQAVGGGYHATVAVGLLDEALTPFYIYIRIPVQLLIPLNRSEIRC